jgi:ABC-type multidrug transport system fused ATPase/permease subunit
MDQKKTTHDSLVEKTKVHEMVEVCLGELSHAQKKKLLVFAFFQALVGIFDLIGIALMGAVGAIAITGLQTNTSPKNLTKYFAILNLESKPFQFQVAIVASLAIFFMIARTLFSAYILKKALFFLATLSADISEKIVAKLFSSSLKIIQEKSVSEYTYALTSGVSAMTIGVGGAAIALASDLSLLILITITLMWVNLPLALITIVYFSLVAFFLYRQLSTKVRKYGQESSKLTILTQSFLSQSIYSFRELFVKNIEANRIHEVSKARRESTLLEADLNFLTNISKYTLEISLLLGGLILSAVQFSASSAIEAITILSLFLAAGMRIAPSVLRVQQNLLGIKQQYGASTPTIQLINSLEGITAPKFEVPKFQRTHGGFYPEIAIQDLSFNYPGSSKQVFSSINLEVKFGNFVVFVGPSGAGKTTLIDLILGLHLPTKGLIQISNLKPKEAIEMWPGAIGYVPQNVELFQGTILENITFGYSEKEWAIEDVWETLSAANLKDFVEDLPQGLHTLVGERGATLSGGQKQRLGIARALFTNPSLIVLDEATNALDLDAEHAISTFLETIRGKKTVLVIAHRFSTVNKADQIVYIEDGKLVFDGTQEQILNTHPKLLKSIQANLVEGQK